MILPEELFRQFNYIWIVKDEGDFDELKVPLDEARKDTTLIINKRISNEIKDLKTLIFDIISDFMKIDEIKAISVRIKENLDAQNKLVYLNDYSLVLYSFIETIQELTQYKDFWFVFYIEPMESTKFFREFFMFLHGCIDFYQFNPNIFFKVIMDSRMRDPVLAGAFPQLYERLEKFKIQTSGKSIGDPSSLNDNPFNIYCTSPNIYLWKDDDEWKEGVIKKFYGGLPIVVAVKDQIKKVVDNNDNKGLIIYAEYGIGKSTSILIALHFCEKNYNVQILPLYIYLHNTPVFIKAKPIIKEITNQILTKIKDFLPEQKFPTLEGSETYISGLKKIFEQLNLKIILLIDEFDVLQTNSRFNEIEKSKLAKFVNELQTIDNIVVYVYSLDNAETFFRFDEFKTNFNTLVFRMLKLENVNNLMKYYESIYDLKCDPEIIKEIYNLSKGFPRLIIKILRLCWDQMKDTDEKVINWDIMRSIQKKYWGIDTLPEKIPFQREIVIMKDVKREILEVLLLEMADRKATAKGIAEFFEQKYKDEPEKIITFQRVAANLRQFVRLKLLKKTGTEYEISYDFFKRLTGGD